MTSENLATDWIVTGRPTWIQGLSPDERARFLVGSVDGSASDTRAFADDLVQRALVITAAPTPISTATAPATTRARLLRDSVRVAEQLLVLADVRRLPLTTKEGLTTALQQRIEDRPVPEDARVGLWNDRYRRRYNDARQNLAVIEVLGTEPADGEGRKKYRTAARGLHAQGVLGSEVDAWLELPVSRRGQTIVKTALEYQASAGIELGSGLKESETLPVLIEIVEGRVSSGSLATGSLDATP